MNEETHDTPPRQPSRLEQMLMKINADDTLTPENKHTRILQAWAKYHRRTVYIKVANDKREATKGEILGQRFLEATGKKWEDATPEERESFLFPKTDLPDEVDQGFLDKEYNNS